MGGKGSGNKNRRKFGNKFYAFTGRYNDKASANRDAAQYEKIGVKTKVVKEVHELPWYPFNEVLGYSVYVIPTYHRKTRRERNAPPSGVRII